MITEYILLVAFMLFNMAGAFLILLRTGDYDADMFTKILGWILFTPGLIGLVYYFKYLGFILFCIGLILVYLIRKTIKEKKNENTH